MFTTHSHLVSRLRNHGSLLLHAKNRLCYCETRRNYDNDVQSPDRGTNLRPHGYETGKPNIQPLRLVPSFQLADKTISFLITTNANDKETCSRLFL